MASQPHKLHFVLFPFMAQGHMIPMVDLAKLLAQRGAIVTIVTTPDNAARNDSVLARAADSRLQIQVVQLQFPCEEVGLPKGSENLDLLSSIDAIPKFISATHLFCDASGKLLENMSPRPSCIVSDMCLPSTMRVAQKHHLPRIVFYSLSCFSLLCMRSMTVNLDHIKSVPDSEYVTLLELPDQVRFRKSQLPLGTGEEAMEKFGYEMREADGASYGFIVNTFKEMEQKCIEEFKRVRESDKVWCIGPVSLCNKDHLDKSQRGDKAAIDEHECIKWLDSQQLCSVIYVSLGSLCNLLTPQIIELGLGLEASKRPFIWVIRKGNITEELEKWFLEYGFEEKTKGRGLVIRGWAPQVLILSHPSIGGFLTHCGWNSTIEGITAGVPMITWPLFVDQIFNEKMITQILRVGISVGVDTIMHWGEDDKKVVVVKRENVKEAINSLMDGDERVERRERCKKLAEAANRAVEEGGSSHQNLSLLIDDIIHQAGCDDQVC